MFSFRSLAFFPFSSACSVFFFFPFFLFSVFSRFFSVFAVFSASDFFCYFAFFFVFFPFFPFSFRFFPVSSVFFVFFLFFLFHLEQNWGDTVRETPFAKPRIVLLRAQLPQQAGKRLHTEGSCISNEKAAPKEEVFGPDIRGRLGGHSCGRPGPKALVSAEGVQIHFGEQNLWADIQRVPPCAVKTCAVRPVFARVVGDMRAADPRNVQGPVKQNASPGDKSEAPRPRWKRGRSTRKPGQSAHAGATQGVFP